MSDEEVNGLAAVAVQLEAVTALLSSTREESNRERRESQKASNRTNVRLWIVIVGFVLDIILTGVIAFILAGQVNQGNLQRQQGDNLAQVQQRLHTSQLQACNLGNRFRDQQKKLWLYLIALSAQSPQQPLTPAQKHAQAVLLQKFTVQLGKTYSHVNCAAL